MLTETALADQVLRLEHRVLPPTQFGRRGLQGRGKLCAECLGQLVGERQHVLLVGEDLAFRHEFVFSFASLLLSQVFFLIFHK